MRKFTFTIIAAAVFLINGCGKETVSSYAAAAVKGPKLSEPAGMAEYLRDLPAVRAVELWENPYGPGLKITTAHYEIFTTLMEPLMLSQVPSFVESAYEAYQSQLPERVESGTKFTTYLFGQRDQWERFTREITGAEAEVYLKIQKGAYVRNSLCVAYNIGRKATYSVLGHEGWHQFNSRFFAYRLPSWLDEGIATLFETCRYEQGRFVFEPQKNLNRLGALKLASERGQTFPLPTLISLNPGQVLPEMGGSEKAVMGFYAQNYALVRFLREEFYGARLNRYHNLLLGGLRGSWPISDVEAQVAADRNIPLTARWNSQVSVKLFTMYIDGDLQRINEEYQAYCRKITYHVRVKK